ncbi:MAG: FKBP-type peptidyl-prolyl cis-trans isomerase [Verrucomicrobiales bacterium]
MKNVFPILAIIVSFCMNDHAHGQSAAERGQAYLETNKAREEVVTTASGLQYEVLREGAGRKPTAADTVEVHYRGTSIDGVEFDSSYSRNSTIEFPLSGVIRGWTEGVQLMAEGSQYRFVIPSELAYGTRGAPPAIGPNEVLVFEIELIAVR